MRQLFPVTVKLIPNLAAPYILVALPKIKCDWLQPLGMLIVFKRLFYQRSLSIHII